MPALAKDRLNADSRRAQDFVAPVKGGARIFQGAIVCFSAALAVPGSALPGLRAVGVAAARADNLLGADGAISVKYERGTFRMNNDPADPVTLADAGVPVFMTDDNTICRTNPGGNTKSAAGILLDVDAVAAWVRIG